MQNPQEPKTPEELLRSSYEDERTQNRIQEHLTNQNDVITEQDIANISTGIFDPGNDMITEFKETESIEDKETVEEEELKEKKVHDNEDPGIQTPWNILG